MRSLLLFLTLVGISSSEFYAGVAKVDATLPVGTPLAGYNYAPRAVSTFPIPYVQQYTTWMNASVGSYDPTWAKALVIDNGQDRYAFVTLDAIGSDGVLSKMAHDVAVTLGFTVPFEKVMFSSSHTHSGPGAISGSFIWSIAPATDLLVPELRQILANSLANAMIEAEKAIQPAVIDIGIANLTGVTHNRRAGISHYVHYDTIDPNLGVIRIDTSDGTPLVTLWNYAIHGICYDAPNLNFTSDVMGSTCDWIEENVGGTAMFWNGDAGDVNPIFSVCCVGGPVWSGGKVIGEAVMNLRKTLNPVGDDIMMKSAVSYIPFGLTKLNMTLQRLDNCTRGGPLDLCSFCYFVSCDENVQLGSAWIEETPKFSAFYLKVNGVDNVIVSIPGEALVELGFQIRSDMKKLGFEQVILAGYSNNHMGYFATSNEYDIGGYESLLTFWGVHTADKIRTSCYSVASQVVP